MGTVSLIVVYIGSYIFLVLLSLALCTCVYYLAETIEENVQLTKWFLKRVIGAVRYSLNFLCTAINTNGNKYLLINIDAFKMIS